MKEQLNQIDLILKQELDLSRYNHTIGVMHTAACMAMRYNFDIDTAMTAGILHDCAKCISNEEKLRLCENNHIAMSAAEKANPGLLHAKLGAHLAKSKYNITDTAILHAIEVHTTGCPNMSMLDKIIYIADYIEPTRKEIPNLSLVRKLAFEDIDKCLYQILKSSLDYLKHKGAVIDPATEQTYLYYKSQERSTN